jgi:ribosomal protein S12 methylthiotransferase accessory factor
MGEIAITFPGGKRVDAAFDGWVVHTDQSREHGGDASAPEPFATFLASLGACAGIYVLEFCRARGISTDGVRLSLEHESHPEAHRLTRVRIRVHVPASFPDKYVDAVCRAVAGCKIKKTLAEPPEFDIAATRA